MSTPNIGSYNPIQPFQPQIGITSPSEFRSFENTGPGSREDSIGSAEGNANPLLMQLLEQENGGAGQAGFHQGYQAGQQHAIDVFDSVLGESGSPSTSSAFAMPTPPPIYSGSTSTSSISSSLSASSSSASSGSQDEADLYDMKLDYREQNWTDMNAKAQDIISKDGQNSAQGQQAFAVMQDLMKNQDPGSDIGNLQDAVNQGQGNSVQAQGSSDTQDMLDDYHSPTSGDWGDIGTKAEDIEQQYGVNSQQGKDAMAVQTDMQNHKDPWQDMMKLSDDVNGKQDQIPQSLPFGAAIAGSSDGIAS